MSKNEQQFAALASAPLAHASTAMLSDAAANSTRSSARKGEATAAVGTVGFAALAALIDLAAIVSVAAIAGELHKLFFVGQIWSTDWMIQIGVSVAVLFLLLNITSKEYVTTNYTMANSRVTSWIARWVISFLCVFAISFLLKTNTMVLASRATTLMFFFLGPVAIYYARAYLARIIRRRARNGAIWYRRIFIVGFEREVRAFRSCCGEPSALGMQIVSSSLLHNQRTLLTDLEMAAASARRLRPDDIFILIPWSRKRAIDLCVDTFRALPASIHLGPERAFARYPDAIYSKIGSAFGFRLVRQPLSPGEVFAKRVFDVICAGCGLLVASPLFLIVAVLIKLDSKGPVLFVQHRRGFNQEEFRIFKFRSMTTMEDDANVVQVTTGDARVTRVGRWLRRFNIDELPQLLNVLRGEMSLVGPRPHALAHDHSFERKIAFYARRHNVSPGITGWAQVNGFRGEITTDEDICNRVKHDLHYIDNWSFWLDLRILWLTIASSKAYHNAN